MSIASSVLRGLVRGYQLFISPLLPPSCKFSPTCSHYALDALARHGAVRGTFLAVGRVLRCNPWMEGGYDPVPPARDDAPARQKAGHDCGHSHS
jgi:putative membrane protein insertion efficiency factor